MELVLLHLMFIFYSFIVSFGGYLVLAFKKVPVLFVRIYSFGKSHKTFAKEENFMKFLEMPKRWFSHFYIFAVVYLLFVAYCVFQQYFFDNRNYILCSLLDRWGSSSRKGVVLPESVVVLSVLLWLQACRRCYECLFVSVYSNAKMNFAHYIVGFTFYYGVGLSLVHDAPGFEAVEETAKLKHTIIDQWLLLRHIIGVCLFSIGFFLQFTSHIALANLRKKGTKVTSKGHHMPVGGAFEYISCPHFFAEILIYFAANIILNGQSLSMWIVCFFTVTNQVATALMNHKWYKQTFKNYPAKRKAIFPFLL